MPLHEIEKCTIQILLSQGVVSELILNKNIDDLIIEYNSTHENNQYTRVDNLTMFRNINNHLREFSLEIQSIIETLQNNQFVSHHAIINTEEDMVSKLHGSHYDDTQIQFFNRLIEKFIELQYFSTAEIEKMDFKPKSWNSNQLLSTLNTLHSHHWLAKDDRNFWKLGLKSFLELRTVLQSSIETFEEGKEATDISTSLKSRDLPQVIVY